jgi:hypothetical protein
MTLQFPSKARTAMRELLLALIALVGVQAGAHADVQFSFTADCPTCAIHGAPPAVFTAVLVTGNEYQVTNITGNLGGFPVLIAAPGTISLLPATPNDNLLFFPPGQPSAIFDSEGLGMTIGGLKNDLACGLSGVGCAVLYPDAAAPSGTIHPATFSVTAIPAPTIGAGLPGLIFAGGGFLAWWRSKRRAQAVT